MDERDHKEDEEVTIIDKDENSDKALSVVSGFVLEESDAPFPNGKLSFVPEEYGKKDTPTTTPGTASQGPGPGRPRTRNRQTVYKQDPNLPAGMAKCEFCGRVDGYETYLAPSRRFCNVTCCKRYSAEKRYYPYGRDEEGVAFSISQGLVNRHRLLKVNAKAKKLQQNNVEDRKRRLAYYGSTGSSSTPGETASAANRSKRGRKPGSSTSTPKQSTTPNGGKGSFLEPYIHPHNAPLQEWSIEDVSEFLSHLGYEAYVDKFIEHEIDGRALSLIRDHHLLMTLKLRLGPALKIIEHVNIVKAIENAEVY